MQHKSNHILVRDVAPMPAVASAISLFWGWPTALIVIGILIVALAAFGIVFSILRKKPGENEREARSVLDDAFLRPSSGQDPSASFKTVERESPTEHPDSPCPSFDSSTAVSPSEIEPIAPVDTESPPAAEISPVSERKPVPETHPWYAPESISWEVPAEEEVSSPLPDRPADTENPPSSQSPEPPSV